MSPYNTSKKTVAKREAELTRLLSGIEITFQSEEPQKLAYQLREAIEAAKKHAMEPFNGIDYQFLVRGMTVIARPRAALVIAATEAPQEKLHEKAQTEFDVVSVMSRVTEGIHVFPAFRGDLKAVERWATLKEWKLSNDPLTLRK